MRGWWSIHITIFLFWLASIPLMLWTHMKKIPSGAWWLLKNTVLLPNHFLNAYIWIGERQRLRMDFSLDMEISRLGLCYDYDRPEEAHCADRHYIKTPWGTEVKVFTYRFIEDPPPAPDGREWKLFTAGIEGVNFAHGQPEWKLVDKRPDHG